jgi:hypothetical protein
MHSKSFSLLEPPRNKYQYGGYVQQQQQINKSKRPSPLPVGKPPLKKA